MKLWPEIIVDMDIPANRRAQLLVSLDSMDMTLPERREYSRVAQRQIEATMAEADAYDAMQKGPKGDAGRQ
ncbi:hypothetical protein [Paraburkholderia nodosa]|uniref:hypothetical protein n=1 Tax=Paraburkholderia nodosa TaxID=392320 RepID=UPI0004856C89|nr:hypothetical protein [Paraburkholderia nodosa]